MACADTKRQRGAVDFTTLAMCIGVAVGMWLFYSWAWGRGHDLATTRAAATAATQKAADEIEKNRQTEAARATEKQLRDDADALTSQLQEAKKNETYLQTSLDRSLRSGDKRLSIRTASCTAAPVPTDGTAQRSTAGTQEARAELHPTDAADIAAITGEADDAVLELNYCIDRYALVAEAMRSYASKLKGQHVETPKPARAD